MNTITRIHGRDYTTLAGLLQRAHEEGLSSVQTKVVTLPYENPDGVAIVQATVKTSKGTFEATGDASTNNVGEGIQVHLVRMAETRAIARALRWATNSASTAEEEIDPTHPVAIFDQRMREGLPSSGNGNKTVTSRQMGMILRLLREQNRRQEDFRTEVQQRFDRPLDQISVAQASELIQELMAA